MWISFILNIIIFRNGDLMDEKKLFWGNLSECKRKRNVYFVKFFCKYILKMVVLELFLFWINIKII